MSEQLHSRWLKFVEALEDECEAQGQDPGVLEANEALLTVSLPISGRALLSRECSEDEILTGDLRALASAFYADYKAEDGQA